MTKKITKEEGKTIFVRLLWALGFFWVALYLREFMIEKYGTVAAFWIGVGIIIFIAYWFDLRFPYWLKDGR